MKIRELFEAKGDFKTLYCSRKLINADDLIKWAKEQGFKTCLEPEDMHVTVAYSKEEIDWSHMTDSFDDVYSRHDGKNDKTKRAIKAFGEKGDAIVLTFECADLEKRWKEFKDDFGASWDHDGYHPHVTITYDGLPKGMKLEDIEPYEGELHFGPEKLEQVNNKWKSKVKEVKVNESVAGVTDTKAFKEWFRNSKVVDSAGNPLIVYHGTSANFRSFNMKKQIMGTIWFTTDKAKIAAGESGAVGTSNILDLYASIQNPAGWDEYDKFGIWELKSRGYDGCILPDSNGHFDGIVFEPTQLKSASRNNGNFDRHNKNLYEEDLYYVQPDGSWEKNSDQRSEGKTKAEVEALGGKIS